MNIKCRSNEDNNKNYNKDNIYDDDSIGIYSNENDNINLNSYHNANTNKNENNKVEIVNAVQNLQIIEENSFSDCLKSNLGAKVRDSLVLRKYEPFTTIKKRKIKNNFTIENDYKCYKTTNKQLNMKKKLKIIEDEESNSEKHSSIKKQNDEEANIDNIDNIDNIIDLSSNDDNNRKIKNPIFLIDDKTISNSKKFHINENNELSNFTSKKQKDMKEYMKKLLINKEIVDVKIENIEANKDNRLLSSIRKEDILSQDNLDKYDLLNSQQQRSHSKLSPFYSFEVESHLAFNNKSLSKLNESFTLRKNSSKEIREINNPNNKITEEYTFKKQDNNSNITDNQKNVAVDIPDITLSNIKNEDLIEDSDNNDYKDDKDNINNIDKDDNVIETALSCNINANNKQNLKNNNTIHEDNDKQLNVSSNIIMNSKVKEKNKRISRILVEMMNNNSNNFQIDNQYNETIGKIEDKVDKVNQVINIDTNVSNISYTPIKDKFQSSFKELTIGIENNINFPKTSKAEKARLSYEEKIIKLEEEILMKNYENKNMVLKYSQVKSELESAEQYRIELHRYIEEFKGSIRVLLRVRSSDIEVVSHLKTKNDINNNQHSSNNDHSTNNNVNNNISNHTRQVSKLKINKPNNNIHQNKQVKNNNSSNNISMNTHNKNNDTTNNTDNLQNNNKKIIKYVSDCRIENNNDITSKQINQLNNKTGKNKFIESLVLYNPNTDQNVSSYQFNHIFREDSTQEEVFIQVQPLIISALDGENVCIFAYGATGSGKTYTMQGKTIKMNDNYELNSLSGVLPRTAFFLFEEFQRRTNTGQEFKMEFSALEIYNENIYDLLETQDKLSEKKNNVINGHVKGLLWEKITSKEDIIKLVQRAGESRTTESTNFNSNSSRSHAMFQLKVDITHTPLFGDKSTKTSYINIVDLAGSEKCSFNPNNAGSKSQKKPSPKQIEIMKKIQTEANFINKSLTTLGRIITMLADKKKQTPPYRESKLTFLLQNSLSSTSKTALIITVCNGINQYSSTRDSLNFAKQAILNL